MSLTVESALAALADVQDPELRRPLRDGGMLRDVAVEGADVFC